MPKPSIKSLTLEELTQHFTAQGEPAYRAKQVTDWLYAKRVDSFEAMSDLPAATRAQLAAEFSFVRPEVVRVLGSQDTTRKFLFRLADGNLIESVLIPASPALYGETSDRRTACVSTQVGCAYGCKFCASGLDGFTRNLEGGEIVEQLLAIERESGEKIDNIVFMGMGEPLANLTNLLRAIRIINAPWGLEIGARHITISTSGLAPQIRRLANEPTQFRLAISLHGEEQAGVFQSQVGRNAGWFQGAKAEVGRRAHHPHPTANVLNRLRAARERPPFDRFGIPRFKQSEFALEADRVDVR